MDFFLNSSLLINLIANWKINKEKNIIVDPISCLIKLSILGFYPSGTKIRIADNMVTILEPSIFQGAFRFMKGDGREDLHNLLIPIMKSIEWYWNDKNAEFKYLFDYSVSGLKNLKSSYSVNSIISHTLELYIQYLTTKQTTILKPTINNSLENNEIYTFLKTLWNQREIHIIIELLREYDNKIKINKPEKQILNSIIELTTVKEKELAIFLTKHFSSL